MAKRVVQKGKGLGSVINCEGVGAGVQRMPTVEKGADVVEFEFDSVLGLRRVDAVDLDLNRPKPEDATVEPQYSPGRFPDGRPHPTADGHGEPINAVPKPYDMRDSMPDP